MTQPKDQKLTDEEASEVLDDVFSMCAKLLHDRDTDGAVQMMDLVELRDCLNTIRRAVAEGTGYKGFGGRISKDGVIRERERDP